MTEPTPEVKPKANIVFTGRLTDTRLKELAQQHGLLTPQAGISEAQNDDHLWNPAKNHQVISIVKQSDGHYIGCMWKTDHVITIRDLVPEHVLTQLLTHS